MVLWHDWAVSHNCGPGYPLGGPGASHLLARLRVCLKTSVRHRSVWHRAPLRVFCTRFQLKPAVWAWRELFRSLDLISPLSALIGRPRHRPQTQLPANVCLVPHVQERIKQNATKKPIMSWRGGGGHGAAAQFQRKFSNKTTKTVSGHDGSICKSKMLEKIAALELGGRSGTVHSHEWIIWWWRRYMIFFIFIFEDALFYFFLLKLWFFYLFVHN